MPLNSSIREDGTIVIDSGRALTIETAADFLQSVRDALESSTQVAIEFDPAVTIDITGLQIICSACRSAAAKGSVFSTQGALPRALHDLVKECGAERLGTCPNNNNFTCIWFGGTN